MGSERSTPRARPPKRRSSVLKAAALLGRRFGLTAGEVVEILERLACGDIGGAGEAETAVPEAWQRPAARAALERYAARKRAIARLAARGQL